MRAHLALGRGKDKTNALALTPLSSRVSSTATLGALEPEAEAAPSTPCVPRADDPLDEDALEAALRAEDAEEKD